MDGLDLLKDSEHLADAPCLPEILEGDFPSESKGCFGQAWSVGEMLRVFEKVQSIHAQ